MPVFFGFSRLLFDAGSACGFYKVFHTLYAGNLLPGLLSYAAVNG